MVAHVLAPFSSILGFAISALILAASFVRSGNVIIPPASADSKTTSSPEVSDSPEVNDEIRKSTSKKLRRLARIFEQLASKDASAAKRYLDIYAREVGIEFGISGLDNRYRLQRRQESSTSNSTKAVVIESNGDVIEDQGVSVASSSTSVSSDRPSSSTEDGSPLVSAEELRSMAQKRPVQPGDHLTSADVLYAHRRPVSSAENIFWDSMEQVAINATAHQNAGLRPSDGGTLRPPTDTHVRRDHDLSSVFGDWLRKSERTEALHQQLQANIVATNGTVRHLVVDDFLTEDFFRVLSAGFPEVLTQDDVDFAAENNAERPPRNATWFTYANPLEVKYLNDDFAGYSPPVQQYFHALSHPLFADFLTALFGFSEPLHYDPVIHGGGLHVMPQSGRLNMHLDYEEHPRLVHKQRRLNIILFMNENWDDAWCGDVQLWTPNAAASSLQKRGNVAPGVPPSSESLGTAALKLFPKRNAALLFATDENSFHGVPDQLQCPADQVRKTINYYYLSDLVAEPDALHKLGAAADGFRKKAVYMSRPTDAHDERLEELYKIRAERRIERADLDRLYGGWEWNDPRVAAKRARKVAPTQLEGCEVDGDVRSADAAETCAAALPANADTPVIIR